MQDLLLWGHTEQPIVVCVEAKVDETFGKKIAEEYNKKKNNFDFSNLLPLGKAS